MTSAVKDVVTSFSEETPDDDVGAAATFQPSWVEVVSRSKRKRIKKQEKNVLIIKSNGDESAVERKEEVGQALNEIDIIDSKFTNAGKIIVNFETEEEKNKAEERLRVLEGVSVTHNKMMFPKIVLCNVDKDVQRDGLIEELIERNHFLSTIDDVKDKMKVIFDKPAAGNTINYFIKCDPEVRRIIRTNGNLLKLQWGRHEVYDRYYALMCFHCLKFGHKKINCPAKQKHEPPKCYKCAGTHEGYTCRTENRKCANCLAVKLPADHSVNSTTCPYFTDELLRIKNNTDHG